MIPSDDKINPVQKRILASIAIAGILLRILDGFHVPVFMDELPILYNVAHFLKEKTLSPVHFNYPTLFSYTMVIPVVAVFLGLYTVHGYPFSGLANTQWLGFLFERYQDPLILGGRMVSVLAMALIFFALYRWGRHWGFLPLLFAFLMLALDPLGGRLMAYSRYALPDVTSALWVTLGILFCIHYVRDRKIKWLRWASLMVGLGISTKYNAAMAVFPLLTAFFLARPKKAVSVFLQMTGLGLLGLLLGSPALLWIPGKYLEAYLWESRHMAEGHLGANDHDYLWVIQTLWNTKTWMLPVIGAALIDSLWHRKKSDWIFVSLVGFSFLVIGRFEKKAIHYFLFLYPVLALFIGKTLSSVWRWCGSRRIYQVVYILGFSGLFLINPGYRIGRMVIRDMRPDNRLTAAGWMNVNGEPDSRLLLDPLMFPWIIDREDKEQTLLAFQKSGNPMVSEVNRYYASQPVFQCMNIRNLWDYPDTLNVLNADYLILTALNYDRLFVQDSSRIPDEGSSLYARFMIRRQFYETLLTHRDFRIVRIFDSPTGPRVTIYQSMRSQSL